MSKENVELTYQLSTTLNQRDLSGFLELMDADVEITPYLGGFERGGPYRGRDGVRTWLDDVLPILPNIKFEIEEVRDLGDVTLVRSRFRGSGAESGAAVEQALWTAIEWRNGKAIRIGTFKSEAEARESAGLSG
jgi:ketosteroid isomerase-like protein